MQIQLFNGAQVSATGMAAERQRMEVIANNIANANSTRSADGGPYRRQQLIFTEAVERSGVREASGDFNGVRVLGRVIDQTELPVVYNPGHPDADPETGLLAMPNVKLPTEMIDLITASRSYEANLKALTSFKNMIEQTLRLLRRGG